MSRVLCDAVIQALKEAHEAYLMQRTSQYRESMHVAECGIAAIEALGAGDGCNREMELMGLKAEVTLLRTMMCLHQPEELIPQYEIAAAEMLLPPSRVIQRDDPMLPHCEDALDFFGGACDQTARNLDMAAVLYGKLTGGGGGVAEIYHAQVEKQRGSPDKAVHWAGLALERMCGDKWIEPIAREIIAACEQEPIS